jgi:HAE1 family hydrophobic/amphiphilic exporter-1
MDVVRFAIDNPVKIAASVILLVLFGIVAVFEIPIQLTPRVDRPTIMVTTRWPGASPQEIETEIVERQENQLKNVNSLEKMKSTSRDGEASIRLEFPVGIDKDVALRQTSDKLRQVSGYPDEVEEPLVTATDNDFEDIIAWMILFAEDEEHVAQLKHFCEEKVAPILERAEGISEVPVFGGLDREVRIEIDAHVLAARGLTFRDVEQALRRQNLNLSAGSIAEGKRDYSFRTVGEYRGIDEIENTVLAYQPGGPVTVRDVARVVDGFAKQRAFVRSQGRYVIAMPARRETGANVVQAIDNLKEKIELVNREVLASAGMNLELTQVYDETTYIWSAIDLVVNDIWKGGLLAVAVLWIFLRSGSATGIIALAIPISVIGTFLVIAMLGRTLNVILLAGLAFAVGMLLDNAVVVLENIYRHHALGKSRYQAALDGGREVWGAVVATSLTTMIVFLPIIFIQEEVGQLFRDIAIAIVASVGISLFVAVLVVPPLAARYLRTSKAHDASGEETSRFGHWVGNLVDRLNRRAAARIGIVAGVTVLTLAGSWLLMPPLDYLPAGNQNLVIGMLISPPGYSIDEYKRMGVAVEEGDPADPYDGVRPIWEIPPDSPLRANLAPVEMAVGSGGHKRVKVPPPAIEDFFFVTYQGLAYMGCTSRDPDNVAPLAPAMIRAGQRLPGVFTFFWQHSLFSGGTTGSTIDVEIRGDHLDEVIGAASAIQGGVMAAGYNYPSADPQNFDLGGPELRLRPDRAKAARLGLDVRDLGFIVEACVEGAFVGEYNDHGDRIDMVLAVTGAKSASVEQVGDVPIHTPTGQIVPISSVMEVVRTTAPRQINHIEEMPSVTLAVQPKRGVPLETAVQELEENIIAPLRASGAVPSTVMTSLAGSAGKLMQTRHALVGDFGGTFLRPRVWGLPVWVSVSLLFALAFGAAGMVTLLRGRRIGFYTAVLALGLLTAFLLVLNPGLGPAVVQSRLFLALLVNFLLMAGLFESFAYPLIIMFSVPPAILGGFLGLRIVHETSLLSVTAPDQQFDMLTVLGFVISLGVVVDNAILIVHQALNFMKRDGMDAHAAVVHSVRTRTRPIFMTSLTTVFGLVPLCIMSGAGSELYRGLGAVQLGGLLLSTVFTLVVVPAMFTLFTDVRNWLSAAAPARRSLRQTMPANESAPEWESATV